MFRALLPLSGVTFCATLATKTVSENAGPAATWTTCLAGVIAIAVTLVREWARRSRRADKKTDDLERRVHALERQNAVLSAENSRLNGEAGE